MSDKYFSIQVRNKEPKTQEMGFLDKHTNRPRPGAQKIKIVVGAITIPNFSRVWGKLEEKDGKPTGKITFLKWGEAGGMPVDIRYLPSCKSLSKLYQDKVLEMKPRDEDAEISLKMGINNFDEDTDALLIDMIKHHSLNGDNESRDPNKRDILFSEYSSASRVRSKVKEAEIRRKAENYVFEARDNPKKLVVLAHLFGMDPKLQNEDLILELTERAEDYKRFLATIEDTQSRVRELLEKALKYKLIDITADEEIHLIKGTSKVQAIKGVKAEGEDKINWVVLNLVNAPVYDGIIMIEQAVTEYERKALA